jgi:ubiquinone/menaquinone biosynthesis C-methylase UbiE
MESSRRTCIRNLLAFFFRQLYTTLAWSYDAVALITSIGQWSTWQSTAVRKYPGPVLELGHGPGHVLLSLELCGNRVIGLDISPQMTNIARRRRDRKGARFGLVQGRGQQLPFEAGYFNAVVATFPTEFILATETLHEISRVLQTGGELVVIGLVRITGRGLLDRFSSWLYRFTGQSGEPDPGWALPLQEAGFDYHLETIEQPRADVLRLRAVKR